MHWYLICETEGMRNRLPSLALLGALLPAMASAQDWGLGLRLGDPSGLTLKKYWSGRAFEVNLGRTHFFGPGHYYRDHYVRWYEHEHPGHHGHEFIAYRADPSLALQMHYLVRRPVRNADGLDWYYGAGGQLRSYRYYYDYRYKPGPGPDWVVVYDERVAEVDLGVDGVLGMEYKFNNAPFNVFLDLTLFMEVIDNPFVFWPQVGLGGRFLF